MFSAMLTVKNASGLHARPATALVAFCQKYKDKIQIINGEAIADAKSIVSVLSAGIGRGMTVKLTVEGPCEQEAGMEVLEFIDSLRD